ncbi:MAG TPA: roadblock/LC7 domain-containing protein [Nannocystaceae bacterium]|nr:roadblock/LC7 domain-containing protein [Nannocystaceae bacterium]
MRHFSSVHRNQSITPVCSRRAALRDRSPKTFLLDAGPNEKETSRMTAQPQPLRRTDQIQEILRGLRSSSSEIVGAAIVNSEGFTVATALPSEVDEEVVAGMGAALLGVGERIAAELMDAEMVQTYVRSANGYIILNAVNEDAILIVLTTDKAKLGLVFLDIKKRLPDLGRML